MPTSLIRMRSTGIIATFAVASVLGTLLPASVGAKGTPDGTPPSNETVCDGLSGAAFGLCVAYCEAQDCDVHPRPSCAQLRSNLQKLIGSSVFPCDAPTSTPTFTPAPPTPTLPPPTPPLIG